MDTENAYSWLYFWVGAKHHSFEGCPVNTSDEIRQQMNSVTKEIMQNAITTDDSTITGVSTMLDAVNEDNIEIMNDTNATASPYMVHSAVLPKPSLIDATVNSAINAMWNIIHPDDTIINDTLLDHKFLSNDNHGRYRPVIPVSRESNEPIIEWTDNDKLLCGAFPDKFILGQGVPKGLLSERKWRHFANYYDGRFEDPLFIAHCFNQLQRAACIRSSARITGKNTATLKSLGQLTNSKAFREQLVWARDHPHSKEAKSLNAKLCRILSMVGSTIPFSLFERAATRPKLNAMRFRYGIGSNFITGAPPEFEDLLTLRLCMNPKLNDTNCQISKQDFKQIDLPDHVRNDTAIRLRMTALCPLLQAQIFKHKLRILLEAVIGCKSSSDTRRSLDYLMYDRRAYHQIAAFNGVLEPQASGHLHWHIMLYSSVLSPELLQQAAAAPINLQTQVANMLDSITHTKLCPEVHQWYDDITDDIQHGGKSPRAADIEIPDPSCDYIKFCLIGEKKSALNNMHGHGFSCEHGVKGKHMCRLVFKRGVHTMKTCPLIIILFKSENVEKNQRADVQGKPLDKDTLEMLNAPNDALSGELKQQHPIGPIVWEQTRFEKDAYYCENNIITTNIVGCSNNSSPITSCTKNS